MMYCLILCCILLPLTGWGQVIEDFSDGDFSKSPKWKGNIESFVVNSSGKLQLDAHGSGTAYLSTENQAVNDAIWEFEVELAFNPSSRNLCRVYILSDLPDLSNQLKGYYVQIGGSQDEISLFRQDISNHSKIIDGIDEMLDSISVKVAIKVKRDVAGMWQLFTKFPYEKQFQLIGQVKDQIYQDAHFFGYFCQFTTTRSQGFFLDNVRISGNAIVDTTAPQLLSLKILSRNQLQLVFNEPLMFVSPQQFTVLGLGTASQLSASGYNTWNITFTSDFDHGEWHFLEMSEIKDLSGNTISISEEYQFWETGIAHEYDLIISEIMADPAPPLQLPNTEYLEIFNRSDSAFNLSNWTLSDASRTIRLPDYLIAPGSFLILCPDGQTSFFSDSLNHLELSSWVTLNNTEDQIILSDSIGNIIHFVNYDDSWYRNPIKQYGGWSLEMIDVNFPCSGATNWTASSSPSGGSPGKINSVATDNPDLTPPTITSTLAISDRKVSIIFDQPLRSNSRFFPQFSTHPHLNIDTFFLKKIPRSELIVMLADSLEPAVIYQFTIKGIVDCNGNVDFGSGTEAVVGLSQSPDSTDIVINEILFNPKPLGERFIELYNRSTKAINLKDWRFARWQGSSLTDFTSLTTSDHMIYPGDYRVFTESSEKLRNQFPEVPGSVLIEVIDLPALGDKEGSILVLAPSGEIIDAFRYHKDMHHPILNDLNGVSLERASPDLNTDDPNNWYSGAEASGYATPGSPNSQILNDSVISNFRVVPKLFSPLVIQLPDYTRIQFQLDKPGSSGSVFIFDQQGFKIKTLVNNSLLSTNGSFKWDGTNDNMLPVPMGYYIVFLQVTLSNGNSYSRHETVAVAPDL